MSNALLVGCLRGTMVNGYRRMAGILRRNVIIWGTNNININYIYVWEGDCTNINTTMIILDKKIIASSAEQ